MTYFGDSSRMFNACIESEENYAQSSQSVLERHFEEDKAEKLTELLSLIERVLTNEKKTLARKYLALRLLKDASLKQSKRLSSCIARQKDLLKQVYEVAITHGSIAELGDIPQQLEFAYPQLALELICYWRSRYGEGESNTEKTFRRLERKLSKNISQLPARLAFFGMDYSRAKAEKAATSGDNKGLDLILETTHSAERSPLELKKKISSNDQKSLSKDESLWIQRHKAQNELYQPEAKDEEQMDEVALLEAKTDALQLARIVTFRSPSKKLSLLSPGLGFSGEDKGKRNQKFEAFKEEWVCYQGIKMIKGDMLLSETVRDEDFIWQAKKVILDLNSQIRKVNEKADEITLEFSEFREKEKMFLQLAQDEDEKLIEIDNYLQQDAQLDKLPQIKAKLENFFARKIPTIQDGVKSPRFGTLVQSHSPKTVKSSDSPSNSQSRVTIQQSIDAGHTELFAFEGLEKAKLSSPQNRIDGNFFGSPPKKGDQTQKLGLVRQNSRNSSARSPTNYDPEVSEQAIRKLMKCDKSVIEDLQKIKNGIVSSLQQRQKPVPWEAFDNLDKIKQEYDSLVVSKGKTSSPTHLPLRSSQIEPEISNFKSETLTSTDNQNELIEAMNSDFDFSSPDRIKTQNGMSVESQSRSRIVRVKKSNTAHLPKNQESLSPTLTVSQSEGKKHGTKSNFALNVPLYKDDPSTPLFCGEGAKEHAQSGKITGANAANITSNKQWIYAEDEGQTIQNTANFRRSKGSLKTSPSSLGTSEKPLSNTHSKQTLEHDEKFQDNPKDSKRSPGSKIVDFRHSLNTGIPPTLSLTQPMSSPSRLTTATSPTRVTKLVKQPILFDELFGSLSISPNPKTTAHFFLTACKGRGCVLETDYLTINAKYSPIEDKSQGCRHIKVTLRLENTTDMDLEQFSITFLRDPNVAFIKLPEKTEPSIPAGEAVKVEFVVSVVKAPITHLQLKCSAKTMTRTSIEELNYKFMLPLTYNKFMRFDDQLTNSEFLINWKDPSRVLLKGEPKVLTNPLINSPTDFSAVLGHLLMYPGIVDENGQPKAYAFMGMFELEKKKVKYLLKINWIPENNVTALEIACHGEHIAEGEFALQTLQFLFFGAQGK